jgi:ferredoxin
MTAYRIRIDRSLCSGMASCMKIAPDAFELDRDGIAVVTGRADERALEAAECCPLGAIAVFDSNNRRLV